MKLSSSNQYLLNIYYVPSTLLSARDSVVRKTDPIPAVIVFDRSAHPPIIVLHLSSHVISITILVILLNLSLYYT